MEAILNIYHLEKRNEENVVRQFMKPVTALYLWLGITPLLNAGFDHDVIFWLIMITGVILIGYFIQNKDSILIYIPGINLFLSLFLIWCAFSIIWTIHPVRSIIELLQLFSFVMVFGLIKSINEDELHRVARIVLITGTGISLFGILEYIFVAGRRIQSTFTNPNPLGIYLAMLLLVVLGLSIHKRMKSLFIIGSIIGVAFILTGSRASYLAFVFSLPFIYIGRSKKQLSSDILYSFICIAFSLLLAAGITYITSLIQENLFARSLFDSMTRFDSLVPTSITGRLEFWKVAIRLIKYHPFQGFGLGSYFASYYLEYGGNQWYSRFVHNHYLQILVEVGIIGFSIFTAFILGCFSKVFKKIEKKQYDYYLPAALAGCLAFLIHIFVDFSWNFPAVTLLFFAVLGVLVKEPKDQELVKSPAIQAKIDASSNKNYILKVSYKTISSGLLIIFLLTFWLYSSTEILIQGFEYEIEGNHSKALLYHGFANAYFPFNSQGHLTESQLYFAQYNNDKEQDDVLNEAEKSALKAINLAPYDATTLNHLGKIYLEKNELQLAEDYLKKASELSAYTLSRQLDLARFYYDHKELDKAEKVLLKAAELSEFAITRSPENRKSNTMIEAALIHHRLALIYEENREEKLVEKHKVLESVFLEKALSYGKN